ncbi:serine/threonine protein kinase [Cytobacillus horneckiae]|uniref:Serine/threonine protein kinase n=1 Tax=Cytobacillus horneckiae TaxID=549687 RepID=A0A2N0ZDQ3_9BACI|nr:serine/threonine-protein kinase [Cytobacillus horneckiae]MEC1154489.1 serine/threonine-protein kinase [Cytobacillus horneckiae]MED2937824.1 serine/threonine-protein kinase [Cytobacillus horneckiae]PKG27641.1 serine/threonine protein kinase [Cytobacillus horneckiae]
MYWKKIIQSIYDRPLKHDVILKNSYRIDKCLGTGGYGIIYQCTDVKAQKRYVLKQLRPSKARRKKETERFLKEVELMKSFKHKQIPELFDSFTMGDQTFYVMELIDGINLEDWLFTQDEQFSELEALKLISQLLYILEYLHAHHIFHSDIRPPNIILMNNEVYLIDFGLAKKVSTENIDELKARRQDDFFDLGECLLFLLYSNFKEKTNRQRSWMEELTLSTETQILIKKLLGICEVYQDAQKIRRDLQQAIHTLNRLLR